LKADTNHEERAMKDEKPKPDVKKPAEELAMDKAAAAKKKKKGKKVDEATEQKVKKAKPEKSDKKAAEPKAPKAKAPKEPKAEKATKAPKAPKDDKLTKFLVSMKKSVRKSIKKEAAEVGVSMNEYIVLAVEEKLGKNPPESAKTLHKER
jgi:hypothetical protein